MNVVKPITIRAAQLTSSTVPYPDTGETAWSSAAVAYAVGATVSYTVDGLIRKFECKTAHTSNATNFPVPYPNETANWLDLGAVNRYNMFHLERNTQTVANSPYVFEITPGDRFGALGFGGVEADSIRVEVYNGATQIYDTTRDMIDRSVASWYDFFYQPLRQVRSAAFFDLPVSTTYKAKVTMTKASGQVKCGLFVAGMPLEIGDTEYRAGARILNFSEISRDVFGEAKITKRRSIPKTVQNVIIKKERLNAVIEIFNDLNAEVALWSGLSNPLDAFFDGLFIIGFYKDIDFSIDNAAEASAGIELEQI